MARLSEDARAALAEEEGEAVDRDLRRFLILVIGKLILGTRGDPVSCRCLPLLEDLSSVGSYAWGAALLTHLFDSLGTSSRETGVSEFFPLLQVWAYYHLPSLGRGVPRLPGAMPLLQRWRFRRDEQSLCLQVTLIHDALDTVPFGHVEWTPYLGEDDAAQPWVERGHPYFGRDIWMHAFNTVVPLHQRLVARTLGLHQLTDWEQLGREVASEATSDEDYFRAYARRYGAQVYKGSRRSFDPEGGIARLRASSTLLFSRGMTSRRSRRSWVGLSRWWEALLPPERIPAIPCWRASWRRQWPEQRMLSLTYLMLQEAELRDSLAQTNTLEAEMAELHLRPEAAEVSRWRQEAEEAMRWCTEVGDHPTQLGEERHRWEQLRSEMKGLERVLALVRCSRSSASRSGIPSASTGHYLTGSSGRRRNEEEARRRERAPEGSETGPRVMAPPSPRPPEGTGESG
ncbi:hypothetical protein Taro_027838 [Colocasia esculenta]|uniref:Aminotransferase-like plant mobile domain-containing protein n=1 Tax=Colocasia esculenta TaxID=4460 RepID=A0A843VVH1_COLES|nr:hypothetical protein [Colocasia esculenta]